MSRPADAAQTDAAGLLEELALRLLGVRSAPELASVFEMVGRSPASPPSPQRKQADACDERHRDASASGGVPPALQVAVWRRDGFRCRFCGRRLVPNAVAWAMHELAPVRFPMHRNTWTGCHPLAEASSADIEHVFPVKRGGSSRDPRNLITSCAPCNRRGGGKAGAVACEIGWRFLPVADDGWDGLSAVYLRLRDLLVHRAFEPLEGERVTPYAAHTSWEAAFGAVVVTIAEPELHGITRAEELPWRTLR
jgi:5-methylcytosine-specific restriction endonuclease McrA